MFNSLFPIKHFLIFQILQYNNSIYGEYCLFHCTGNTTVKLECFARMYKIDNIGSEVLYLVSTLVCNESGTEPGIFSPLVATKCRTKLQLAEVYIL